VRFVGTAKATDDLTIGSKIDLAIAPNESSEVNQDNDEGYSVGAALVQQFEEFGTELYFQYRLFSLDRDAASSVQDINVGTIGARVKF
jgi:hypothetical protein